MLLRVQDKIQGAYNTVDVLIGIHEKANEEGTWETIFGDAPEYVHWAEGEPNDAGYFEDCGGLHGTGMNDVQCHRRYAYICELPVEC